MKATSPKWCGANAFCANSVVSLPAAAIRAATRQDVPYAPARSLPTEYPTASGALAQRRVHRRRHQRRGRGKPGVGKSHLLAALGHELILQGKAVLWTSKATLVQQLLVAKRDLRLPHVL